MYIFFRDEGACRPNVVFHMPTDGCVRKAAKVSRRTFLDLTPFDF